MSSAAVRRYWSSLVALGCCLCGRPAEVAHCHGGSIVERLQEPKAKGVKLPYMDWLVLPLCPDHHRDTSRLGLDRDVRAWEQRNGAQAMWIDRMERRTGVDAWAEARSRMRPTAIRRSA